MFGNCNKGAGGGHNGRLKTIRHKWAVVSVVTNNGCARKSMRQTW